VCPCTCSQLAVAVAVRVVAQTNVGGIALACQPDLISTNQNKKTNEGKKCHDDKKNQSMENEEIACKN
jgi:hypothetical protein